ncbi:MAG: nucleotidyltransferase family protein [Gemmatimonadales bacterium]
MNPHRTGIAQRLHHADRSGRIGVLWPDLPLTARWEAHGRVAAAVAAVLVGATPHHLDDGGIPRAMGLAAFLGGVAPLLGSWCDQGAIATTPALHTLLTEHLRHGRAAALRRRQAWTTVHRAFRSHGVTSVTLKGMHTGATLFAEPGVRPAHDVDVLIAPTALPAAQRALTAAGLTEVPGSAVVTRSDWVWPGGSSVPRSVEMLHGDDPIRIDLHTSLRRTGAAGRLVGLDVAGPDDSEPCAALGPEARVLRQPLLTAYLAFHAGAHFPAIPLIRLVELVLLVRRDGPDWGAVLDRLTRDHAVRYAYPTLVYAERLAPATIPTNTLRTLHGAASPYLRRLVARTDPGRALHTSAGVWPSVLAFAEGPRDVLWTLANRVFRPSTHGWRDTLRIYRRRVSRLVAPDTA